MTKYCPDVFKSVYLEKIDQDRVGVGFCCQNLISVTDNQSIKKTLDAKRLSFISNDQDKQCSNCWSIESRNGQSRRHASIRWFESNNIDTSEVVDIINLDWNSENICNLACITCGPKFSSRWSTDISKYSWSDQYHYNSQTVHNQSYRNLDFSKMRRIYFNGGEPLLNNDHLDILDFLKVNGHIDQVEVAYNTNCTRLPMTRCLDLWRQAKLVRLFLSIDAIEDGFEFVRWPAKWHQVLTFIEFIKSLDFNVQIDITCTLGIHNIFSLPKLLEWHACSFSHNHQGDPVSLNLQPCGSISHGGKVLSINTVGYEMSQMVHEFIKNQINRDIKNLFNFRDHPGRSDHVWLNYLEEISRVRNLPWQTHLPDLYSAFKSLDSSGK